MTDLLARLTAELGDSYEVLRELGGGGMSLDRFRREIQLVAKLQNPHIVPVLSTGEVDGVPFFTMPFDAQNANL